MRNPTIPALLLFVCIGHLSWPQYSETAFRKRQFQLLQNQFLSEDTFHGKRVIEMSNIVNVALLKFRKDSLFADSKILARRIQDEILGVDWVYYCYIRVSYFDRYDQGLGYQWIFFLEYPYVRWIETFNRKKMLWLDNK
jgi:hypothetical protein